MAICHTQCLRGTRSRLVVFLGLAVLATGMLSGDWTVGLAQPKSACPLTPIYWGRHPEHWPLTSMKLGKHSYSETVLLALLRSERHWNASAVLVRQLIAARLNIANGVPDDPIAVTLADADIQLGTYNRTLPYYAAVDSPVGEKMVATARILNDYNYGLLTKGCAQ